MKIAIVSQYYRPENAGYPNALAAAFVARGHSVRVVTGFPNYPQGRIYEGYRQRVLHREDDAGVQVKRVPIFISHSRNPFGRLANYLSFGLSALFAGRFVRDADVVYVYATQMTAAIAPQWWKWTLKIPYVLHIQDLWPESITGSSMMRSQLIGRIVSTLLKPWLQSSYRDASAVLAIAPTMREMLLRRGAAPDTTVTALNWAEPEPKPSSIDIDSEPLNASSTCTVVYAGNLGEMQDLTTAIMAASQLTHLQGFRLIVYGAGVMEEELRRLVESLEVANIEMRGSLPLEEMPNVYALSDFQLITLRNLPIFRGTLPSKLQSSLAYGVPVISNVAGDLTDIVKSNGVGITCEPGDIGSLSRAFLQAYSLSAVDRESMARKAKLLYNQEMSRERAIDRIESVLSAATGKGNTRRARDY